jgi:hypothetical protein
MTQAWSSRSPCRDGDLENRRLALPPCEEFFHSIATEPDTRCQQCQTYDARFASQAVVPYQKTAKQESAGGRTKIGQGTGQLPSAADAAPAIAAARNMAARLLGPVSPAKITQMEIRQTRFLEIGPETDRRQDPPTRQDQPPPLRSAVSPANPPSSPPRQEPATRIVSRDRIAESSRAARMSASTPSEG